MEDVEMVVQASVVIPAHDEVSVLGRCLDALLDGPAALDVIVVANGCSDGTAALAHRYGVRVLETEVPGKAHALNLGDAVCLSDVRVYLDADVVVQQRDVLAVVDALAQPGVLAAAPRLRWSRNGVSRIVRSYYTIWSALPYVREDMVGSGFYALSAEGRARFDRFPELIGDDRFIRDLFQPGERCAVEEASFEIFPPRTVRSLLAIKTRARFGNLQQRTASGGGRQGGLKNVLGQLRLWPHLPVYVVLTALAEGRARARQLGVGSDTTWDRDLTSRTG